MATPFLANLHLHWTVPLLAGLWWGALHGFWIGAAAALWGKLLGGMAGLDIDWFAAVRASDGEGSPAHRLAASLAIWCETSHGGFHMVAGMAD